MTSITPISASDFDQYQGMNRHQPRPDLSLAIRTAQSFRNCGTMLLMLASLRDQQSPLAQREGTVFLIFGLVMIQAGNQMITNAHRTFEEALARLVRLATQTTPIQFDRNINAFQPIPLNLETPSPRINWDQIEKSFSSGPAPAA